MAATTISPASRNGPPPAAWGSRNGESAAPNPRRGPRHAGTRGGSCVVGLRVGQCRLGKTHVLVQRVIRLLLAGVSPEKILCITFTKAAAANMAERVFSVLGHWITLDDTALDAAIRESGLPNSNARLAAARPRTVRLCAGNAGWAEGADHSRALHPAAAAVPVRGQCAGTLCGARRARPDRDNGARQSRGAAGRLARSRQRHWPRAQCRDGKCGRRDLHGSGARRMPEPRAFHGVDG